MGDFKTVRPRQARPIKQGMHDKCVGSRDRLLNPEGTKIRKLFARWLRCINRNAAR